MAARTCPFCGAELKAEVLAGLCPKCVLHKVMAEPEAGGQEAEVRGQHYFSMRLVAGQSLAERQAGQTTSGDGKCCRRVQS